MNKKSEGGEHTVDVSPAKDAAGMDYGPHVCFTVPLWRFAVERLDGGAGFPEVVRILRAFDFLRRSDPDRGRWDYLDMTASEASVNGKTVMVIGIKEGNDGDNG